MGFVYYAEYLHFFERARSAYIRQCGMSYSGIEERGIYLPVREATCRYRSPAKYDDLIVIHIGVSELRRASVRFVYEIKNEDKTLCLAEGMTLHALINRAGRPQPMPEWFRELCSHFTAPESPLY